jgi:hypothetical protein
VVAVPWKVSRASSGRLTSNSKVSVQIAADVAAGRGDPRAYLARIAAGLADAVAELQELSRGIHPAVLSEHGLGPALRTLARRSAVPVDLDVTTNARCPEPIEVAAYYVASEALATLLGGVAHLALPPLSRRNMPPGKMANRKAASRRRDADSRPANAAAPLASARTPRDRRPQLFSSHVR